MSGDNTGLSDDELLLLLNRETARISWLELQPQFARGQVLKVGAGLDLIQTALTLVRDDREQVELWTQAGNLQPVPAATAQDWYDQGAWLWALVVAPWVLVQKTP